MVTTSITTERVETRAGGIAFRRVGTGPYAVLWHSLFVDGHSWDRTIEELCQDRTLLVVDGPGYGASDALRHRSTIREVAEAAGSLIDQVAGGSVDWVGNAWGGHVGIVLAATDPGRVRTLVTISTPTQPTAAPAQRRVAAQLPFLGLVGPIAPVRAQVLKALLTDASRGNPEIAGNLEAALRRPTSRSLANTLRSFMLGRIDSTPEVARLRCPTLIVASDDWVEWTPESAAACARLIPGAQTATIEGARALAPLEQPAAVMELIRTFWAQHTP